MATSFVEVLCENSSADTPMLRISLTASKLYLYITWIRIEVNVEIAVGNYNLKFIIS